MQSAYGELGMVISIYNSLDGDNAAPDLDLEPDFGALERTWPYKFEWLTVAFAIGIGVYFWMPVEPDFIWPTVILGGVTLSAYGLRHSRIWLHFLILAGFMLALGVMRSAVHTRSVEAPILDSYRQSYDITGWIEAVQPSGKGFRWEIAVTQMSNWRGDMGVDTRPRRVRVRAKPGGLKPGDGVSLRALMTAPPGPVIADGYDPARRAYFSQIGGYGFAISTPQPTQVDVTGFDRARRTLVRVREHLTQRIMASSPKNTAGLQAALLTGERSYIPPEQTEALRAAGLAHVLAISGLHMGLIAGGAFWLTAFLLACVDKIARRWDVRKAAAIAGIIVATAYLILSGASVSTQRAYIMAIVLFAAVLLSRPSVSMRSVAVAAAITLWLHPESLMSAGFQMSFAAAAGLVAVYGAWRQHRPATFTPNFGRRAVNNFTGLAATSAIAGVATGGFAAIHFHAVARMGFFANLAAMPLFTFVVMPMGFAAFLLMPLGLEEWPLYVMGRGLEGMLWVSTRIAAWPGSRWLFSAAPIWAPAIFGLGFVALCLGPNRIRIVGLLAIIGLWTSWSLAPSADMRVSDSGHLSFWETTETGSILYKERKRADGYGVEQFIERAGEADADIASFKDERADCDSHACLVELKGKIIAIAGSPEIADQECASADIVILTQRSAGPVTRRHCRAVLLDETYLKANGAQDIYLRGETITMRPAITKARKSRPWGKL